ncbi:PAS domain S-box protein [Caenimonas terrae]|uniref:histidine kinase n=1 Tax=Caenimonas terrae TaxID=696074 RepID=A0ABW0NGJ1_9BURK
MPISANLRSVWSDRVGSWTIDVPDLGVQWSAEASAILGLLQAPPQTLRAMVELVRPEWWDTIDDAIMNCIQGGAPFDVEVQMEARRPAPLWVRVTGEAQRNPDGLVCSVQGTLHDVSGKLAAVEQFRQLSEQFSTTLESLTDAFFTVDREWRFTYVNRKAEALFRHARAELLGRVMWEVFPSSVGSVIQGNYELALAAMQPVVFETFSSALQLWLEVAAYPDAEGLAVYFRDVSGHREVREALVESEERYRLLFESSADAIFEVVPDGTILHANPAACLLFGMTEQDLLLAGSARLVAADDQRVRALLAARDQHGKAKGELTVLRGDGSRLEVEATVGTYTTMEGKTLLNVVLRDITQRLRHQQEIMQLNAELNERVKARTAQLESANSELMSFAHALAHDLRAPIATILGFSTMLGDTLEKVGAERIRHYLQRIRVAARQMDDFIGALLAMASVAQSSMDKGEVDLSAAARGVLADLQEREPQRKVVAHVQDGMVVHGDANLLRVAVENLVGNAWKFSGGREVSEISLTAQDQADGEIVYCVKDNGAGFDMAYADKLFGNFQRLHSQDEFPGTGVGLANVRRIVGQHGGRVWGESQPAQGATFKFTLEPKPKAAPAPP